jgi:hypothetical protein
MAAAFAAGACLACVILSYHAHPFLVQAPADIFHTACLLGDLFPSEWPAAGLKATQASTAIMVSVLAHALAM